MLTITHTHEAGTLIEGTSRGDGTAEVLKANGWRWGRSIGAWYVPMSRDHSAKEWKINATRDALEAAGFAVVLDVDNTARPTAEVEAAKIERQAARVDALEAKADRKSAAGDAANANARRALDRLPEGGEPIHVGHYSENRHRNAIDKADRAIRRSIEADEVATEAARRADVAAHTTDARYNPITVANRIKKLGADIRDRERKLTGYRNNLGDVFSAATGDYAERLTAQLVELRDSLGYWEGVRAEQIASGRVADYSPATIHKGDFVKSWRGWCEVVRVNAKTVTVLQRVREDYSRRGTVPYAEITGYRAAEPATAADEPAPVEVAAPAAVAEAPTLDIPAAYAPLAMVVESGYVAADVEHISSVSRSWGNWNSAAEAVAYWERAGAFNRAGVTRYGNGKQVLKPASESNDAAEYEALGITATFQRITFERASTEPLITRAVSKGANPAEARRLLADLVARHSGDNLASALVYKGFATERQALQFAAAVSA